MAVKNEIELTYQLSRLKKGGQMIYPTKKKSAMDFVTRYKRKLPIGNRHDVSYSYVQLDGLEETAITRTK